MAVFLREAPTVDSRVFIQASDTYSASFNAGAFLVLPESIKGSFSDNNEDS